MRRLALAMLLAISTLGAAVPPPGNVIRVRGIAGDTIVSLLPSESGGLVRLDVMARLLGGGVDSAAGGRWRLTLQGTALEMRAGSPFITYNGFALPMLEPMRVTAEGPHVPLQLFSEIVPRFGLGVTWDRTRYEVRLLQGLARGPAIPRMASANAASTAATPPATITPAAASGAAVRPRAANAPAGLSRRYTVAVDAGHGGVDPGNAGVVIAGRRVNESLLTLQMARKLEAELRARGLDVVMIRSRDTLIALHDRGPLANGRQADLFVSLHTNAANPRWRNGTAVRGVETFFLSAARTEDERRVAAMENDVVRFETQTETQRGDPLSFILNDLAQNEHLRESSDLAELVQRRLSAKHPGPSRGVKQAGFSVLMRAFMPAILVEVGFGTNAGDAAWMASSEGQKDIADSISDAIFEYLQHYERRTRPVAP